VVGAAGGAVTTMTDRPSGLAVATIAGALFCVVLIYLSLQIRAGQDPAIGPVKPGAEGSGQVLIRRIVVRRIVEEPAAVGSAGGQPAPATSGAVATPVAVAPAPTPTPVVSGGS